MVGDRTHACAGWERRKLKNKSGRTSLRGPPLLAQPLNEYGPDEWRLAARAGDRAAQLQGAARPGVGAQFVCKNTEPCVVVVPPAVIVVGHQTSGKSALIEALMGFQFNQVGGGTKTRRPVAYLVSMQYSRPPL